MDSEPPEGTDGPTVIVSVGPTMHARLQAQADLLGLPVQEVLDIGIAVLEWYTSFENEPHKQVMVVDLESGKASLPALRYQQMDESGVLSIPLLPSERSD